MAAVVGVLLFAVMADRARSTPSRTSASSSTSPSRVTTVSDSIFSQYIVPFEAVSVLLLAALIGAIVVARKD